MTTRFGLLFTLAAIYVVYAPANRFGFVYDDAYQILRGFMPRKPYPTLDGFKMVFAELSEQIPAAKTADPRDFVDTRFLEEPLAAVKNLLEHRRGVRD